MLGNLWGGKRKRHGVVGTRSSSSLEWETPHLVTGPFPPFRILGPDHLFPTRLPLLSRKSVSPPHFSDPNIAPSQYSLVSSWSPSGSTFTLPASDPTKPLTTEAGPRCLYSRIFRHVLVSVTIGSQHSIHFLHQSSGVNARVAIKG